MNQSRGFAGLVFAVFVVVVQIVCATGCTSMNGNGTPPPPPSASLYISSIQAGVERARRQMPAIIESADTAARRVTASGGRVFVAGSQPEFATEMIARAGGLACVTTPPPLVQQFNRSDVVLYATRSKLSVADHGKIARWHDQGVYVIAFASDDLSPDPHFRPDVLIDSGGSEGMAVTSGKILPTDTVINLINAWAWTGEFIAACTRRGRTPIIHQSPDSPGGKERTGKYLGRTFHDDVTLPPIEPGALGNAYLDRIEASLIGLATSEPTRLQFAGGWLHWSRSYSTAAALITGTLFPDHFRDARAPQPFAQVIPLSRGAAPVAQFVAVFGGERAPQLQIEAAHMRRYKLFYSTVRRGLDDVGPNVAYVDPRWPAGDACLKLRGYDVPILPASSIMQATIYWSLLAEAERLALLEESS